MEPVVSQQCSMSGLGADAPMAVDPEAVDVRDNELNELDSQPLHASGSGGGLRRGFWIPLLARALSVFWGGAGERVLDPSPSDTVVGASTGQTGESQEMVMDSSPTFSPLSGSVSSETPASGGSCVVGSAGDSSASSNSDSRPVRSRIPVKVTRGGSGELLPPLVSREETVAMVQKLKAALPSSADDLVPERVGDSSQSSPPFTAPLPPRVSSRSSGSGMALRPSSRSRSRSGDERPPLSPDPHRSRRRAPSPSPARRR